MENNIDNIGFPQQNSQEKKLGEKKELLEDSQAYMWGQLSELRNRLLKENQETAQSEHFEQEKVDSISKIRPGFFDHNSNLGQTANWYEMEQDDFLKELKGKTVLDIGSSLSTFAAEAKEKVECDIVSLDIREAVLKNKEMGVVAEGEALPFQDESFDEVFATYSLPHWAFNRDQVELFFNEALRVTKHGGKINIVPIAYIQNRSDHLLPAHRGSLHFVANDVQIATIDTLEKLRESDVVEINLNRNFKSMTQHYSIEEIKKSAPTLVSIKKL